MFLKMCKEGFSVEVNGQAGRISRLRQEKGQIIGDFIERGGQQSRAVNLKDIEPSHKKAQKNIEAALKKIGINNLSQLNSINGKNLNGQNQAAVNLSKQAQRPGDRVSPGAIYA